MPLKLAGRIVLPAVRQITLDGLTVVTLEEDDVILEITAQTASGGVTNRLLQMYPDTIENRLIWIWNNSGANALLGRDSADPGYHSTPYDFFFFTLSAGQVACFQYYVHGGLPGAPWATWHKI